MPIVYVSGLMSSEEREKRKIRAELRGYFTKFGYSADNTTVAFNEDSTTGSDEHVMAQMYSKSFMKMDEPSLDEMCDEVVAIMERFSNHPFHEAFPVPVLAMRGRWKE